MLQHCSPSLGQSTRSSTSPPIRNEVQGQSTIVRCTDLDRFAEDLKKSNQQITSTHRSVESKDNWNQFRGGLSPMTAPSNSSIAPRGIKSNLNILPESSAAKYMTNNQMPEEYVPTSLTHGPTVPTPVPMDRVKSIPAHSSQTGT